MKSLLLFCIAFIMASIVASSQITITQFDMPQPGDTIRISSTTDTTGLPKPALTDTNYIWNYSKLNPMSQTMDTFLSVSATPYPYQYYFNNSFLYPAYKATVAQPQPNPPPNPLITVTTIDNYYKGVSSSYAMVGFGANINSVPTSIKYDSIDFMYRFPMQYGKADSCYSQYHISVPKVGYYDQRQRRINHVDGWGTLITPYGTFSTLRITTLLFTTDSTYSDSFKIGFLQKQPEQIQYKWFGIGSKLPLLQVNERVNAGKPIFTNAVYRDNIRSFVSIEPVNMPVSDINVFPNPANETCSVSYYLPETSDVSINLYSADGRKIISVLDEKQCYGTHQLPLNVHSLSPGIYFLKVMAGKWQTIKKILVIP